MAEDQSYVPSTNEREKLGKRARLEETLNFDEYQRSFVKIRTLSYDPTPRDECAITWQSRKIRNESENEKIDSREQFSWLQKCLDLVVFWRDPLRTIRDKFWGVDWAMEESFKYTIKYLLDDGLLGCFVNSIVLNNRLDRICRELDSLDFQSNVFSNLSLSGSNNRKNNGSLPRRRKRCRKRKRLIKSRDDRSRDLTAEVGLGSMKASAPPTYRCRRSACKRAATYDSPSNEKIDRTERMESCWNREDSQDTFRSYENTDFAIKILPGEKKRSEESRDGKGSSSLSQDLLKKEQERISRSTLKVIIRKARSWDCTCSISLKPIKSCRLSLPCEAGDVTKEIFKADPSLRESCLIVMRRKFEMGVYNLCSCLNDVLHKLNEQIISELRLILEIRPSYINFKLIGKRDHESRSCLFTDRVPICQSVYKRDVTRIVDNSIDFNEVSSFNEFYDTFNDSVIAPEEAKNINEENCEKLWLSFFSPCSDTSLNEVERTLVDEKIDMAEEEETQLPLDFSVTARSEKEEKASSTVSRINYDILLSRKGNEDVVGTVNFDSEIDYRCRENDDNFMRRSTMEERVDVDEEIKLDSIVECSCCSLCGTPILSSRIEEDVNTSKVEDEILNLIKNFIEEIEEKVYVAKTEDTCTVRSLNNEDISNTVKEDNEESISCDCSMSLDSLMTRKTYRQEEINSNRDSRYYCHSKVSSSSSLDEKSNEDFSSGGGLKHEDKFPSSIPSEIEEIDASRVRDDSDTPLLDIPETEDKTSYPMAIKNSEKIVCYRKDFVSLSIQTSRTGTSSKFTNVPTMGKNEMIILAKSWSKEKWTRKVEDETTKRKEREREKRSEIWKLREKGSSRKKMVEIVPEKWSKRPSLPTEKRSICTCDISKRGGYRGRRRRFKDESWTSRIKNYVSFRRSKFLSISFCESFHSSRLSIGRLRNLLRAKLRRLMSIDGRNESDRTKRKFPVYQKTDEIKRSDFIYRRRRNDDRIVTENFNDFFSRKTERHWSIIKDKTRIQDKDLTYNLRSCHGNDRYSKESRSITKVDENSSTCQNYTYNSSSSNNQRLVGRKFDSEKMHKKSSEKKNSRRTFEFRFDREFWEERTDRSSTVDEYEKSICDVGLDIRSKLEQYVALCKNIKSSLIGNGK